MKIRKAVPSDIPQIKRLYSALFAEMSALSPEYWRAAEQNENFIKSHMSGEAAVILAAEDESGICGFAALQSAKTPPYPCFARHDFAMVTDVCVAPGRKREGIGSALLEAAKRWARERGLEYLELNVLSSNEAAKAAYAKAGFAEEAITMRAWISGNER